MPPAEDRPTTVNDMLDRLRQYYDEEIAALISENRQIRKILSDAISDEAKAANRLQPKVVTGLVTAKAINMDKIGIMARARRDIDAESSDNVKEDWTQIVLADQDWTGVS